jgi:hypothetical protein
MRTGRPFLTARSTRFLQAVADTSPTKGCNVDAAIGAGQRKQDIVGRTLLDPDFDMVPLTDPWPLRETDLGQHKPRGRISDAKGRAIDVAVYDFDLGGNVGAID